MTPLGEATPRHRPLAVGSPVGATVHEGTLETAMALKKTVPDPLWKSETVPDPLWKSHRAAS